MVIEGLARPILKGVNLLRVLKSIVDFNMSTLMICGTSSANTRVLLFSRHIDRKGVWIHVRRGIEYADEVISELPREITDVLCMDLFHDKRLV